MVGIWFVMGASFCLLNPDTCGKEGHHMHPAQAESGKSCWWPHPLHRQEYYCSCCFRVKQHYLLMSTFLLRLFIMILLQLAGKQ